MDSINLFQTFLFTPFKKHIISANGVKKTNKYFSFIIVVLKKKRKDALRNERN